MIPECDPDLVALIGCAGGFPDKIERFDVVVPPRVDYVARSKVTDRTQLRPQQEVCSQVFIDHCKNVQLLDLWHQYLLPDVSNAPINVYFEPIISGETVLANSRSTFFRSAQASSPKSVAIEMEGYGFLSACREHRVEAAVIRGISDTLDNKNELNADGRPSNLGLDRAQLKATRHAAALFFATLDFVNVNAFRRNRKTAKTDMTEVSMILDAEMHNVSEIQADLFELFKKYGIRNFSFKPANSIRVGFEARRDAMRIYGALVTAGIIKNFGGFKVLNFGIKTETSHDGQLADILARIEKLRGTSADEYADHAPGRLGESFPDHAAIVVDALEHQHEQDKKAATKRTGRILYPRADDDSEEAQRIRYFGRSSPPAVVVTQPKDLRERLDQALPSPPKSELLTWFMGNGLLDREIGLDLLLAHSKQKFFYSWPELGGIYAACNLSEKDFIDGCITEWAMTSRATGASILQIWITKGGTGWVEGRSATQCLAVQQRSARASIFLRLLVGS